MDQTGNQQRASDQSSPSRIWVLLELVLSCESISQDDSESLLTRKRAAQLRDAWAELLRSDPSFSNPMQSGPLSAEAESLLEGMDAFLKEHFAKTTGSRDSRPSAGSAPAFRNAESIEGALERIDGEGRKLLFTMAPHLGERRR